MKSKRPKIAIIIQARMRSTRLPGKVMKKVLGKPLLWYLIERLRMVKNADQIVVATTTCREDDAVVEFCKESNLFYFRGDEEDVLARYENAAIACHADVVVRITADCPLIDPRVIDQVIECFLRERPDYAGNTLKLTYPRGMDTEVFSADVLEDAAKSASKESEREHVTLYIYRHPEKYKLVNVAYKEDQSRYRLTVDTEEDFKLIGEILERLYPVDPRFSLEDILKLLQENPELANLNRHVAQKTIKEH